MSTKGDTMHTRGPCKCEVVSDNSTYHDQLSFCPLHAAAPALYEAAKHAAMSNHHPSCTFNKKNYQCQCHVEKAKAALALADGKES